VCRYDTGVSQRLFGPDESSAIRAFGWGMSIAPATLAMTAPPLDPASLLVRDAMTRNVLTATRQATVLELESATRRGSVHRIVIAERGRPVGIACRCDLARARAAQPAWHVMTSPVVTIFADEPLRAAVAILHDRRASSLPVVDCCGQLRGIVTRRDLRRLGALEDERDRHACFGCGTTHGLRVSSPDAPAFCDECLSRSRGDPEFGLYGTLGGGG
jgi:signal-transduction protein with cAMP-binding, CBS, and nucleotidyltransferase domain